MYFTKRAVSGLVGLARDDRRNMSATFSPWSRPRAGSGRRDLPVDRVVVPGESAWRMFPGSGVTSHQTTSSGNSGLTIVMAVLASFDGSRRRDQDESGAVGVQVA